jgi:hypothetical protein
MIVMSEEQKERLKSETALGDEAFASLLNFLSKSETYDRQTEFLRSLKQYQEERIVELLHSISYMYEVWLDALWYGMINEQGEWK